MTNMIPLYRPEEWVKIKNHTVIYQPSGPLSPAIKIRVMLRINQNLPWGEVYINEYSAAKLWRGKTVHNFGNTYAIHNIQWESTPIDIGLFTFRACINHPLIINSYTSDHECDHAKDHHNLISASCPPKL